MSLERKPVMVRLSEEAYRALDLLANIEDKDLGEKAREIVERVLLGEVHAAKVQAERFARALTSVNERKGRRE
jgi:hypothetical protein